MRESHPAGRPGRKNPSGREGLRGPGLAALVLGGGLLLLTGCPSGNNPGPNKAGPNSPGPAKSQGGSYTLDLSKVAAAKAEPDTVGIFFCLDTSGSMGQKVGDKRKIDISKESMRQVFAEIAAYAKANPKKKVKVGLCSFADRANVIEPLGPFDQAKLERAIEPLQPQGGTAIGDAMATAVRELVKAGAANRAVIVMTDGENTKGTAPEHVVEAIMQNSNTNQVTTGDIALFLVAFDVNAKVFDGVKQARASVKEAKDQKSLQGMLKEVVDEVLLEAPNK